MQITDEVIVKKLRAGETVKLERVNGMVTICFTADEYADVMRAVGALAYKDWRLVEK